MSRPDPRFQRARLLTKELDQEYLWRSDWTHILYRHNGSSWQMYLDGSWQNCHNEHTSARWNLIGSPGESFIRVGKEI